MREEEASMPVSGVLERLLDYWHQLPREEGVAVPLRSTLQPTDLHELLPRISLMKRLDRYDVQVSMVGTSADALWQAPMAGINAFDLTVPSMRENTAKLYAAILDQPSGVHMLETVTHRTGKPAEVASLYLPLADRSGSPTYIIGCSVYVKQPRYGRINDRLMLDHSKISNIEFIDLGRGKPAVAFERPSVRPRTEQPAQRWWDRFMPSRPRAGGTGWLDA
jgi:hypothetical protein